MSISRTILNLIWMTLVHLSISGQNEPVSITATGYGPTMDAAITASIRSALEQTFGVFISSDTRIEMEEDESSSSMSVIDEMAVLTSGNIADYTVISSTTLESGEAAVTTQCTIALEPMKSFVKSKGQKAEFAGGMFGRTMKLRELNVVSEEQFDQFSAHFVAPDPSEGFTLQRHSA